MAWDKEPLCLLEIGLRVCSWVQRCKNYNWRGVCSCRASPDQKSPPLGSPETTVTLKSLDHFRLGNKLLSSGSQMSLPTRIIWRDVAEGKKKIFHGLTRSKELDTPGGKVWGSVLKFGQPKNPPAFISERYNMIKGVFIIQWESC